MEAAGLFNLCQDSGVQCGAVDVLMCAVAQRKGFTILTGDQGLMRCIQALRAGGLALYRETRGWTT